MAPPEAQGQVAPTPQDAARLQSEGHYKCLNPTCDFHFTPERMAEHDRDDTLDCPECKFSYNMLDTNPFSNEPERQGTFFKPGGKTVIGLSMANQGQIGEEIVRDLKEIPGFGPITWWSDAYHSPLDGGTADWGIEVKTVCIDAQSHQFVPGGKATVASKNRAAQEMGLKGILGLLVVLDYRRSVADVYVREMPFNPWGSKSTVGIGFYRAHNGMHLVKEIPFKNPFLDPTSQQPQKVDLPF